MIKFDITDLLMLCKESIRVLQEDTTLLRIEAPVIIIGDVHGQFYDLMEFMKTGGDPKDHNYLFLGDYVDRGRNSIETITYLLVNKILYPKKFWLIRGNHETPEISRNYGFYTECALNYTPELWNKFNEVFDYLPLAAVISDRIFAVHGGLSPDLKRIDKIASLNRPIKVPETGFIADILWSDPENVNGWHPSERGTSFCYGPDIVDEFLNEHDFDLICRGHQVVSKGYEFPFEPKKTVLTVFSAPNYCEEFGNRGAMLVVDNQLRCQFSFIEPQLKDRSPIKRPLTAKTMRVVPT